MSIERIIPRRNVNDDGKGKKFALHKLITASSADYVWLTDDDVCVPAVSMDEAEGWLREHGNPDMVILPLRMTHGDGSLLAKLQQAEYAAIQQLTIETAQNKRAVMCSGANLIVKRERWLESYEDIHPELPSGDDMFLLESFKRRQLTIMVWDEQRVEASVEPENTLIRLFRQRMRWAGKANRYTDIDIIRCGFWVAVANAVQLVCPAIIAVKFPIEYSFIRKRDKNISCWVALLLEIIYPLYMTICLIGGLSGNTKRHHSTRF